ncbi:tetratricopeptide repeat protein, partial [Novosphingobium sp. ZW T3_23]|uniref:tetratricopeptide repeat protein n=1 Tax=Novosphingobium sp. ZW T3_23 TaxID=3378084 RepID=UPI0038527148
AKAQAQVPRLIAPDNATRRWNLGVAPKSTSQLATVNALLEKAMAAKEPSAEVWQTRANLRRGTGDFKGARADLDRAIALSADASSYLDRARLNRSLGDLPAALADARKAQELDPSQSDSAMLLATLMAQQGDAAAARELLDEKIALGGDERRAWEMSKVETLGLYADATEALGLLDVMMEKRPQSPDLLNLACWIKGMRGIDVDGALRQCSSAIELTGDPSGPLDSRAVVWLRLGRYDDALRDLDAVLRDAPTQAESRYMRGVVLAHLGRAGESRAEIAVARTLDPGIAALYERLGIKP